MDDRDPNREEALGDERSRRRLTESRTASRHVIASFDDVGKARAAARRLSKSKDWSQVRLRIRKDGPVAEGESPEEIDDMDVKWLEGAALGALIGAAIGALVGSAVGVALWLSNAASVGLSFALAVPIGAAFGAWALAVTGAYRKTWDMSYRDVAMDEQAVVAVDTNDPAAADRAFTALLQTDAQLVEEFDRGERLRMETGAHRGH